MQTNQTPTDKRGIAIHTLLSGNQYTKISGYLLVCLFHYAFPSGNEFSFQSLLDH